MNRRNLNRSINIDCRLDRRTNSFAECHASRWRVNNFYEHFENKTVQYLKKKKNTDGTAVECKRCHGRLAELVTIQRRAKALRLPRHGSGQEFSLHCWGQHYFVQEARELLEEFVSNRRTLIWIIEWFSKRTGTSFQNGAPSKKAEKKLGWECRRVVLKSDLAVVSLNEPSTSYLFLNILTLAL